MARGRKPKNPRTYKNPNGYGTVYEIKSGNRRKPFVVCVTTGWDIVIGKDGKPHKRQKKAIIGYAETYEKGMAMLTDYHKRKYAGIEIVKDDATFKEMFEIAMPRHVQGRSDALRQAYNAAFGHLKAIHNIAISEIKTGTMQQQIDIAVKKGKGHETLSNIRFVCEIVFNYALQNDIVNKNYAEFLTVPPKGAAKTKKIPFSDEEIIRVWNSKNENSGSVLILLYTGMRINELLKIKTKYIHLKERYMVTGSKTDAGKDRIIPIALPILNIIEKLYNEENEYLITENGKQIKPNYYRDKMWSPVMRELHMSHLPHECRHTFCTICDDAGMSEATLQKIVGHKGKNITQSVYIHKDAKKLVAAIDAVWPTKDSVLATC